MEQYQIRLNESLTIENFFDRLSLRCWMMIQKDLKPDHLTLNTYKKLSDGIRENLGRNTEVYDVCGDSCQCNEVTLSKPFAPGFDLNPAPHDKIYQLFVSKTFDEFMEDLALDLSVSLKEQILFGHKDRVRTVLSTVIQCVLGDYLYWNSLCRVAKRAECQPSCCSLML